MKALTAALFLVLINVFCVAQLITKKQTEITVGPTSFNPEVIKQNKIKKNKKISI